MESRIYLCWLFNTTTRFLWIEMRRDLLYLFLVTSILTFGVAVAFPIEDRQRQLWKIAFLIFVIGDGLTTGMINRYDSLTEAGPATERICGSDPSFLCAFGSRLLFFFALLVVSRVLLLSGHKSGLFGIILTGWLVPVVLIIVGVMVVLWNLYGIVMAEIQGPFPAKDE